jgi:uncharacterized protein
LTGREVMTVRKDMVCFIKRLIICTLVMMLVLLPVVSFNVPASDNVSYTVEQEYDGYMLCKNDNSGYEILIDDKAGLFTEDEIEDLVSYMAPSSEGGFVLLVTTDKNPYGNADSFAGNYYRSSIPDENGVMLLIDMDTRELLFYSEGSYQHIMTRDKSRIIADNIYRYAGDGRFYETAREGFIQVADVLAGRRIAAPMKYISNACLAVLISLIINYFFARSVSKKAKPKDNDIVNNLISRYSFTNPSVTHTNTTRTYSPRSSSSSGGGGRSGGGGGGGHSSGGHRF